MSVLWSIVVPGLLHRSSLHECLSELRRQSDEFSDVEVLCIADTGRMSLGRKLDLLNAFASGGYVSRVEDDDRVSPDYVATIRSALLDNPGVDTVTFPIEIKYPDGSHRVLMKYDIDAAEGPRGAGVFVRPTDGKMVIRRELWEGVSHPDTSYRGEDWAGPNALLPKLKTQVEIAETLYYGVYDPDNKDRRSLVTKGHPEMPWS